MARRPDSRQPKPSRPSRASSPANEAAPARAASARGADRHDAILDAALALAGERSWEAVQVHEIAARLGLSLADVRACFADKDSIGNRLFGRATDAMLALRDDAGFAALPPEERVERTITTWFDALRDHRAAARAILLYKFAPSHVHLQAALVVALSRTVQWIREAALLDGTGRVRRREETRLTLAFAATLLFWLSDTSPGQERTHAFARRRVEVAARWLGWRDRPDRPKN